MYKNDFHKIMTREIWDKYKGQSCATGFSFEDCILPCIIDYGQPSSLKRMFAGSQDSYRKFKDLNYYFLKYYSDERAEEFYQGKQLTEDQKKLKKRAMSEFKNNLF